MDRQVKKSDDYLDRLYKLLPAEITGAYIAVRTQISVETTEDDKYLFFFGLMILLLAPFFYWKILGITNWLQNAFLSFSFVVWAANIDAQRIFTARGTELYAVKTPAGAETKVLLSDFGFFNFISNQTFLTCLLVVWVIMLIPLAYKPVVEAPATPKART
jgi:hypothetical protein